MHKSKISNKHSKNNLRDKNTNRQLLQKRQIQNTKNNKWDQIQNNYKIKGRSKKNMDAHKLQLHACCSEYTKDPILVLNTWDGKIQNHQNQHPPYFTGWLCCSCNIYKLCL